MVLCGFGRRFAGCRRFGRWSFFIQDFPEAIRQSQGQAGGADGNHNAGKHHGMGHGIGHRAGCSVGQSNEDKEDARTHDIEGHYAPERMRLNQQGIETNDKQRGTRQQIDWRISVWHGVTRQSACRSGTCGAGGGDGMRPEAPKTEQRVSFLFLRSSSEVKQAECQRNGNHGGGLDDENPRATVTGRVLQQPASEEFGRGASR